MQGKRMSDIKKVFLAGKEAYNNPKFIFNPKPYTGPMAENIDVTFKFAPVPKIFNDTWYVKIPVPYPKLTARINGKLFFKYRQKYRNKTNKKKD
jgi:hypothetical protein